MSAHITSPTNPALKLCQEYALRTGGYDEVARIEGSEGWTTAHELVQRLGVSEAVRDVTHCHWLSMSEIGIERDECAECLEVRHA